MEDKPEEEYDHFERAIRKTGCWKEHEACANCINIMKDWRECKEEVEKFRICMQSYMKDKVKPSGKASN